MSNLTPQTMSLLLSLLGIVVLVACLLMVATRRIPELKAPQVIKGFGVDLNVSVITLLVLVGLVLALTSTYLQVKNYDNRLVEADRKLQAMDAALTRAGKMNVTGLISFEGINDINDMPNLQDVSCRYYVKSPDREGWMERAKVTPGIYGMDLMVTFENITPMSSIERLELADQNPERPRMWAVNDIGYLLSPKFTLRQIK